MCKTAASLSDGKTETVKQLWCFCFAEFRHHCYYSQYQIAIKMNSFQRL